MINQKKFPAITGLHIIIFAVFLLVTSLLIRGLFFQGGSREVVIGKEGDVPPLSENDMYKWKGSGPYTVVNYFSLDCPHCLKLDKIENEQYLKYREHFSLVYRHSPLTDIQIYSGGKAVISECHRVLKPGGSICWQVGNYLDKKGVSSIQTYGNPDHAAFFCLSRTRALLQDSHRGRPADACERFRWVWRANNKSTFLPVWSPPGRDGEGRQDGGTPSAEGL